MGKKRRGMRISNPTRVGILRVPNKDKGIDNREKEEMISMKTMTMMTIGHNKVTPRVVQVTGEVEDQVEEVQGESNTPSPTTNTPRVVP